MTYQPLRGQRALVTGANSGIGEGVARAMALAGADVVVNYISDPAGAEALVRELQGGGRAAMAIRADSADPADIRAAVSAVVEAFGPLDAAVVNAGVLRLASLESLTLEDLDVLLSVNIRGVVLALQASAAAMRDGGRLITIGSNSAVRTGTAIGATYAMTKAAVAALVRGVALDLAPRRITVNNVQPGPIDTDMNPADGPNADAIRATVALGRHGTADELAAMVAFVASPEASFVTGANLTVDGGVNA